MEDKKLSPLKRLWNFAKNLKNDKDRLLNYRKFFLCVFSIFGIFLGYLFLFVLPHCIFDAIVDGTQVKQTLLIVILALPVSFYLWYLRNNDKLAQLEATHQNNHFNSLSNAMRLFLEKDNMESNVVGLKLLMRIKNEDKLFMREIDQATQLKDLSSKKVNGKKVIANLSFTDLRGVNLRGANLSGTGIVRGLDITDEHSFGTHRLSALDSDASGAYLWDTRDKDSGTEGVDLQGADLSFADLSLADLRGTHLFGATLFGADLHGVYLSGAHANSLDLRGTNLFGADLSGASLCNVDLRGATLCASLLCGTDLDEIKLLVANDKAADLINSTFTREEVEIVIKKGGSKLTEKDSTEVIINKTSDGNYKITKNNP